MVINKFKWILFLNDLLGTDSMEDHKNFLYKLYLSFLVFLGKRLSTIYEVIIPTIIVCSLEPTEK